MLAFHLPASLFDDRPSQGLDADIYDVRPGDEKYIELARLFSAAACGAAIWGCTVLWLRRCAGAWAAVAGGLLVGASPLVLAHLSLATTDAAFTASILIGLAFADWFRRTRSRAAAWGVAGAAGVCFATKYTGAIFLPFFAWALVDPSLNRRAWRAQWARQFLKVVITAVMIGWAAHGMAMIPLRNNRTPVDQVGTGAVARIKAMAEGIAVPAPIKGLLTQGYMASQKSRTYLAGSWSEKGWRSFYFVGIAVKSDPAEGLLLAIGLITAAALAISAHRGSPDDFGSRLRSTMALALLLVISLGKKQLGVRYALPLYPLLGSLAIATLWRWRAGRGLAGMMVTAHVAFLAIAPAGLLSYFSPAFGGRAHGDRWLIGSDYDWGQDLGANAKWVETALKDRPLVYIGLGSPPLYAMRLTPVKSYDPATHPKAILLTSRAELRDPKTLAGLLDVKPDATPTELSVAFDLDRPEVQKVLMDFKRQTKGGR